MFVCYNELIKGRELKMELAEKLKILTNSAKYDASCSSSGASRKNTPSGIGNSSYSGICHTFSGDGRCISLLKLLMTNCCMYDCQYCINRISNDIPRASLTPREIADLTIQFYKRNYIEGLFLSSAIVKSPDYTMEQIISCLSILRNEYKFNGYIHAKIIPNASDYLVNQVGLLADRTSVNIELPSKNSLKIFAPQKNKEAILKPMRKISSSIKQNQKEIALYKHAVSFSPAGQSTQMIIGATPETDKDIIKLSENLYNTYSLKRVYYSAYVPVGTNNLLPTSAPPLLREHRLYQADWLLRFYGFSANELLDENTPNLNTIVDPKCDWALRHKEFFPVEINSAPYCNLLRVPGIGIKSAKKIFSARKYTNLRFEDLKKMHISLKRAKYFITCNGKTFNNLWIREELINSITLSDRNNPEQIDLFTTQPTREDVLKCLTGEI